MGLNTPYQAGEWRSVIPSSEHEFRGQFDQYVSQLIVDGHFLKLDITFFKPISNNMTINIQVFCAFMKYRVLVNAI